MRPTRHVLPLVVAGLVAFADAALAAAEGSGLPLPRFVSLRSDESNLRTGPGDQYPIAWTYNRRNFPVEIVAEFQNWRKIRDFEGTEGWVHKSLLSGQRTVVITGKTRTLRRADADTAAPVALLEPTVVGKLLQCPRGKVFCRIEVEAREGWLRRDEFWGVYPSEWID